MGPGIGVQVGYGWIGNGRSNIEPLQGAVDGFIEGSTVDLGFNFLLGLDVVYSPQASIERWGVVRTFGIPGYSEEISKNFFVGNVLGLSPSPGAPCSLANFHNALTALLNKLGVPFVQTPSGAPIQTISISQAGATLASGTIVAVTGTGYTPGTDVTATIASTPTLFGSATADSQGNFTLKGTVPTTIPIGAHTLQISGIGPNNSDLERSLPITITGATTTTAITSSPNAIEGQNTTLTATVTPNSSSGTPTGFVTFTDATTNSALGTAALRGGVATLNTSVFEEGSHNITASYGGNSNFLASSTTNSIAIGDAPLSGITTAVLHGREGVPLFAAAIPVSGIVARFADSDPGGNVSDYAATVTWGDGTVSAGTVTAAGSSFTVNGSHTYGEDGNYVTSVHIVDAGGSSIVVQSRAHVAEPKTFLAAVVDLLLDFFGH